MSLSWPLIETGELAKAELLLLESKDIFESLPNYPEIPSYMSLMSYFGDLYFRMGRYEDAENYHLRCKSLRETKLGKDHLSVELSLNFLSDLYWKTDNSEQAAHCFSEGSALRRKHLSNAARHFSEKEVQAFTELFEKALEKHFSFASDFHVSVPEFSGACFDNVLFYKGFLLNTACKFRNADLNDPGFAGKLEAWKTCQTQLAAEHARPSSEKKNITIDSLEAQANALEKDLARTVAGFGEAIRQVSWQEVQAALQPGEAAVEFIHFNYFKPEDTDSVLYAALLLAPGMEQPLYIPLFEENTLENLLPPPDKNRSEYISRLYQNQALAGLVWSPVEPHLQGVKTVYYAPSGLLHRLNLAALPTATGEVLSTKYDLVQLGSSRQLVSAATSANATREAVLFGGIQYEMDSTAIVPLAAGELAITRGLTFSETDSTLRGGSWKFLKNSERETSNVAAILRQAGISATTLKGYAATEEAFKKIGGNGTSPRILHLSTHGYFFPDSTPQPPKGGAGTGSPSGAGGDPVFKTSGHPMIRSGLILAGANHAWQTGKPLGKREDGVLTAYEISQMDLRNTELVVLSACETGLGDIRGNEGVYGLQRAFKIAGAKNLIMSLWQVPDYQTQELMTLFYQKWLLEKMPVRIALHAAQAEMRAKGYEPFYWAGFVLVE
jgi:CHAT domain-containing protein